MGLSGLTSAATKMKKQKNPLAKPAGVKFLVRADSRPLHAATLFLAAEQPVRGATQGRQRHRAGFRNRSRPAGTVAGIRNERAGKKYGPGVSVFPRIHRGASGEMFFVPGYYRKFTTGHQSANHRKESCCQPEPSSVPIPTLPPRQKQKWLRGSLP